MTAKQLFIRYKYFAIGAVLCLLVLCLAVLYSSVSRKPKSADTLAGKWVGTIIWNDASGRPYQERMRTALFFLPDSVVGTVITFPTGAIGGAGKYTLLGSRLTVRCTSLTVNGRPLPLTTFSHAPWYRDTAVYAVSYAGGNLTLTPTGPGPTPAPCWPLLVSPKPLVFSRIVPNEEPAAVPAPRE